MIVDSIIQLIKFLTFYHLKCPPVKYENVTQSEKDMFRFLSFHPSSIFPFVRSAITLKDVRSSLLWSCAFASLWFRFTYFLLSDTDKDIFHPCHTASPTLSGFYAPFSAPNALLLLNYFTVPLASVDCEKCVWCKGPLMHVLMDLEKSSQSWDMWLIVHSL